jgi:spermidine synthase
MSNGDVWVSEKWHNVETRYSVRSILYDEKSNFQHVQIVDTHQYGKMLILDGIVQTTEKDEFVYHEMMVHVPMLSHSEPLSVLIVGGGDGGILREVLRYESVKKVVMVEIDSNVINLCREYLPSINDGAFENKRTSLLISDGAAYVQETHEKFDVVIVDSPDPIGPARVLFSNQFYKDIHGIMNPNAILVRQTGSIHMQAGEQKEAYDILKNIFSNVDLYVFAVPTYVGGLFSAMFCSDGIDPMDADIEILNQKKEKNNIQPLYYNPWIHKGAFHVPDFIKERLS